jgi:hypothetical protein
VAAHTFEAVLDPSQSINPVDSDGVGFAMVYAWPDSSRLHIELEATGLTSPIIGSHIHEAPPGVDGPIRFDLGVFEGRIVRDFATTPAEIATLHAGDYYVNIHTERYLFGEIRGQIGEHTVSSVPGDGTATDGSGPNEPGFHPAGSEGAASVNPLALTVRPTVTSGPVELSFDLERAGDVVIEGYSASGRKLGSTRVSAEAGRNHITLDLGTTLGGTIPRGRIFLQVRADERLASAEITVWK